jgi:hypothetical protein
MIMDRGRLRVLIKQKMQLNGLYNPRKQAKHISAVNDTERFLHEVMRVQIKKMIGDLVNLSRNRV